MRKHSLTPLRYNIKITVFIYIIVFLKRALLVSKTSHDSNFHPISFGPVLNESYDHSNDPRYLVCYEIHSELRDIALRSRENLDFQ